jgi:hypothetical protein
LRLGPRIFSWFRGRQQAAAEQARSPAPRTLGFWLSNLLLLGLVAYNLYVFFTPPHNIYSELGLTRRSPSNEIQRAVQERVDSLRTHAEKDAFTGSWKAVYGAFGDQPLTGAGRRSHDIFGPELLRTCQFCNGW